MIDKEFLMEAFRKDIIIKIHAYDRIKERNISFYQIEQTIEADDIIEFYQDDYPIPNVLVLGYVNDRPIHIVCAPTDDALIIITAYYPDRKLWKDNWKERRGEIK